MMASDVLGRERLDALLSEGKTKEEITAEARALLDPVKTSLGDDVCGAFSAKGVPFSKMKEYADYQTKQAEDAAKKAEEKARADQINTMAVPEEEKSRLRKVDTLSKGYEKRYKDDSFAGRLKRGALRIGSEMDVLTDYLNPLDKEYDPKTLAFLQAAEKLDEDYKKKNYTPEENLQNEANKKAFADANGTAETLATGAKDLYFNITHPAGWDMAGLAAELANPTNLIGGGAGTIAGKVASKVATKAAVGTAVGAGTEGAINAGYEYALSRGRGRSDEESKKAALLGGVAGAAFGGVTGGAGAILHGRWSKSGADTTADPADRSNPNGENTFTVDGDTVELPDDIKNSTLLQVEEAQANSAQASEIITDISAKVVDPVKRDALIEKYVPPTAAEAKTTLVINDGKGVSARLSGNRLRDALEKSIAANTDTPDALNTRLTAAGFNDESRAVIVDAYIRKDIGILDEFLANKIEKYAKGEADARADTRDAGGNTIQQEGGAGGRTAGTGTGIDPNQQPQQIPGDQRGNPQDGGDAGLDTRNPDAQDGIPTRDQGVAGQQTVGDDGRAIPRSGNEPVVQAQDGISPDAEGVAADISIRAQSLTGNKYVWGGEDLKSGADCSGFVQSLYEEKGIDIPRTAYAQSQSVKGATVSYADLKVGDAVYFKPSKTNTRNTPVTHTGIITGFTKDGTPIMTHAKSTKSGTVTEPMSQAYQNRFYNAKRFTEGATDADGVPLRDKRSSHAENNRLLEEERADADAFEKANPHQEPTAKAADTPDLGEIADAEVDRLRKRGDEGGDAGDIETPVQKYERLKNDYETTSSEKAALRAKAEAYAVEQASLSNDAIVVDVFGKKEAPISGKSAAPVDISEVKTFKQLINHRYFNDMVSYLNADKDRAANAEKRPTIDAQIEQMSGGRLEDDRMLDKSDDRYKAALAKNFTKSRLKGDQFLTMAHNYTKAEMKRVKNGNINKPLALKLREELDAYMQNPLFETNRADIDEGFRTFANEAEVLSQMKADEVLELVHGEQYEKGYVHPLRVDDSKVVVEERVSSIKKILEVERAIPTPPLKKKKSIRPVERRKQKPTKGKSDTVSKLQKVKKTEKAKAKKSGIPKGAKLFINGKEYVYQGQNQHGVNIIKRSDGTGNIIPMREVDIKAGVKAYKSGARKQAKAADMQKKADAFVESMANMKKPKRKKPVTPELSPEDKIDYAAAYDKMEVQEVKKQGTQQGLGFEGTQNDLFDVEASTDHKTPRWAKDIVSDTTRYSDIIQAVTDAKNGKPSHLSRRVVTAMKREGIIGENKPDQGARLFVDDVNKAVGDPERVKLPERHEKALAAEKDPLKRDGMRQGMEQAELEHNVAVASRVERPKAKAKLKEWEKMNLNKDGTIRKVGDC